MASRRVRIKGIANIPQRRKPGNEPAELEKKSDTEQSPHNLNAASEPRGEGNQNLPKEIVSKPERRKSGSEAGELENKSEGKKVEVSDSNSHNLDVEAEEHIERNQIPPKKVVNVSRRRSEAVRVGNKGDGSNSHSFNAETGSHAEDKRNLSKEAEVSDKSFDVDLNSSNDLNKIAQSLINVTSRISKDFTARHLSDRAIEESTVKSTLSCKDPEESVVERCAVDEQSHKDHEDSVVERSAVSELSRTDQEKSVVERSAVGEWLHKDHAESVVDSPAVRELLQERSVSSERSHKGHEESVVNTPAVSELLIEDSVIRRPVVSTITGAESEVCNDEKNYNNTDKSSTIDAKLNVKSTSKKSSNNIHEKQNNKETPKPASFVRRKFLKPAISTNAINRKPKEKTDESRTEQDKENLRESVNVNLSETEISVNTTNTSPLVQKIDTSLGPYITKLGTSLTPKYGKDSSAKSGSDTEYPPPPASPSKVLNRTRIKAIPRLDQRRTSFGIGSASESEDDTRRSYSRIRNDSVCSVASGINETHPTPEAASPVRKELISVIQRKCRRTEQSRKLAEARREFQMKFNNGIPDKQKLTMLDLIFYNPVSNPMSQKKKHKLSEMKEDGTEQVVATDLEKLEEERTDDPLAPSDHDEDAVPAPQIKIGAGGEIILDEKSLVIENAETKKGREALQNSELVDGDFDTSYGVFKRVKRSKDWTREETLRFYKALNTIGTDFTIMCELFPQRTRRELKMKFKKEERMNRSLIDKAIMQPVEFDMTELRKDLENEARREEEMKRRKKEKQEMRERLSHTKIKRRKLNIKGIYDIDGDDASDVEIRSSPKRRRKQCGSTYDVVKGGINSLLDDSDYHLPPNVRKNKYESEESANEDAPIRSKTRSAARTPKAKTRERKSRKEDPLKEVAKHDDINKDEAAPERSLEPGSIMIISSKMSTGEMLYKVFMVTDGQNKQQLNLEPDMVQNLTQTVQDKPEGGNGLVKAQNILTISAHEPEENNYTIDESAKKNGAEISELDAGNETSTSYNGSAEQHVPNGCCELSSDIPFDECSLNNSVRQNITISHDENKMIIVAESSNT